VNRGAGPVPRLVAVDMDGTFLRDDKTYDGPRFARLLEEVRRREIIFVVASGNQYYQLREFFPEHPELYFAAENGAMIVGPKGELAVNVLEPELVAPSVAAMRTRLAERMVVCGRRSAYMLASALPEAVALSKRHYYRLAQVDDFDNVDDDVLKFTCIPEEQHSVAVAWLREVLDERLVPTTTGPEFVDIIRRGVNKGAALEWLGIHFGIPMADMVAFGDGSNDLEMLRMVGHGVAVDNAHPRVHDVADARAASNNASGVLEYLERLLGLAG
jgi:Cof subfamily protein (haloacid dehalogenase superfamily)